MSRKYMERVELRSYNYLKESKFQKGIYYGVLNKFDWVFHQIWQILKKIRKVSMQ